MGKKIITQRRGRGSPRFRVPSHRFQGKVAYPSKTQVKDEISGQVVELLHDPARSAPVMKIILENFTEIKTIAPEGIQIGDWLNIGGANKTKIGDIQEVGNITEGTEICNIETHSGDGGKLVRSSGSSAAIVSHQRDYTILKLPSKRMIRVKNNCRATIGRVAGSGRKDKPFARAGQSHYKAKARNKLYPRVRGCAMNALNHPHGGGRNPHGGGKTSVSRNTSPGRKVGHIAPKRTGKRKR
ncbi:50S ribosomal protein L2 [Candidatus Altiarchaeota archaeon]